MKKTLVSTLTTAFIIGAASTTFAAANPFSDVPADHWAYDSVAQLKDAGIIEGYTNGDYMGNSTMTRYEMAQIVAKAMTRLDSADEANKARIDKLAAEFSDELANLGVRVSNLENKVDNLTWSGFVRYEWNNTHDQGRDDRDNNNSNIKLRMVAAMNVNDNWTAYGRLESDHNMDSNKSDNTEFNRAWVQGEYDNLTIKFGKFEAFEEVTHGLLVDDAISGAEVTFGKNVQVNLAAGRWDANIVDENDEDGKATYLSGSVRYVGDKLDAGVGYHEWRNLKGNMKEFIRDGEDKISAVNVGAGYKFDDNFAVQADYAHFKDVYLDSFNKNAYNFQVNYKGADQEVPGSFGLFAAYRKTNVKANTLATTADTAQFGAQKGWVIGGDYTFTKNVVGFVEYFHGKRYDDGKRNFNALYGKVEFLF